MLKYDESKKQFADCVYGTGTLQTTDILPEDFNDTISFLSNNDSGVRNFTFNSEKSLVSKFRISGTPFSIYINVPEKNNLQCSLYFRHSNYHFNYCSCFPFNLGYINNKFKIAVPVE